MAKTGRRHHWWRLTPEQQAKIAEFATVHPGWSSRRIRDEIAQLDLGPDVSHQTVLNELRRQGLKDLSQRVLRMQEQYRGCEREYSDEQIRVGAKVNPCIREVQDPSTRPGQRLVQGVLRYGTHVALDTYSLAAVLWRLQRSLEEDMVDVLRCSALPFFSSLKLRVDEVLTEGGTRYGRTDEHPYRAFLRNHGVAHKRPEVGVPFRHGFLDRFRSIYAQRFRLLEIAFITHPYRGLPPGQAGTDIIAMRYNSWIPFEGYPHWGRTPWEMLAEYVNGS